MRIPAMRRAGAGSLLVAFGLFLWGRADLGFAAELSERAKAAIEETRRTNPELKVEINPANGMPTLVRGLRPVTSITASAPEPSEAVLRAAFENYFTGSSLSATYENPNPQSRILSRPGFTKDPDIPGQYIVRGAQQVQNIPVFASDAATVLDSSASVLSASTNISNIRIEQTQPSISDEAAIAAARAKLAEMRSKARGVQPFGAPPAVPDDAPATAKVTIFDPALIGSKDQVTGPARLAYLVSIDTFRLFVDARTGEVFYFFKDHPSALIRRVFDVAKGSTFPGNKVIDENTRAQPGEITPDADHAFMHAGVVYDYYFLTFGRRGVDDSTRQSAAVPASTPASTPTPDTGLDSYVRFRNDENAWWCIQKSFECPAAGVMVYGPGYAGALDIVGHEVTHGVITQEANLNYADEPGAINEAFADIFGTLIEFFSRQDKGNWMIGEGLPGAANAPLRDMANPHLKSAAGTSKFNPGAGWSSANDGQPDHWKDYVKRNTALCSQLYLEDNGCVHINSGILNKMAYLIAEGGTHGDTTITGIGKAKLGRVAYRTLTVNLNSGSGFFATASAFRKSCEELARRGIANISNADCGQVSEAIKAVGLDTPAS
jgi:Zn-dependent metalloprotease